MEQVNNGNIFTVVFGNFALSVLDLYIFLNAEDIDLASLGEEDFFLGGICRVSFVVHCQAWHRIVVLDGKDKESWSLVVLDPVWHREPQSYHWVFWGAHALWKIDRMTSLVIVWLDPIILHGCTSEQHEWSRQIEINSSRIINTSSNLVTIWLVVLCLRCNPPKSIEEGSQLLEECLVEIPGFLIGITVERRTPDLQRIQIHQNAWRLAIRVVEAKDFVSWGF